jgi:hypothetical protein
VDHVVLVLLVVSFASLVTVHVALAFGLAMRRPRWRGAVAFLLPPLAPYWGMRVRSLLWLIALASYVVGLIIAKVAVD